MTSKRMALALTSTLLLGACGGGARSDGRALQPEPTAAKRSSAISVSGQSSDGSSTTIPAREEAPESTDRVESTTTTTSTAASPSTTAASVGPTSNVTSPTETFDLSEVRGVLDGLNGLFGELDSQIGSIDLDEGETP